MFCFCFFCNLH